jgi:hypothetical protein
MEAAAVGEAGSEAAAAVAAESIRQYGSDCVQTTSRRVQSLQSMRNSAGFGPNCSELVQDSQGP